ncbi:MAG: hypothetical protein IJG65_00180 [Synergistaceae bacterium]|nr:hypothetical protein [Synergistaceae bacterium]
MKRFLINTTRLLLFLAGFLYALYVFLPWQEAGRFIMSFANGQLERRGMSLSYSDVTGEDDGFTVHNLTASGMGNVSFSSVTLRPRFIASILSLAPVCDVEFRGGSVTFVVTANFGDGRLLLTAGSNEVLLENVHTNGDFSLNGYMTLNVSTMKIGHADARLDPPEGMNMDIFRSMLPLVREGDRWYLRR